MATKTYPMPRKYFVVSDTAPSDTRDLWIDPGDTVKYWDSNTWAPVYTMGYPLPSGTIIMWSGAVDAIPYGYVLCDGQNGTPDLRNRFVVGAGDSYNPDATGGAATHTHSIPVPNQSANAGVSPPYDNQRIIYGSSTNSASSLPPFYALCYIMKT